MDKHTKITIVGTILIVLLIVIGIGIYLVKKYTPSKEWTDYAATLDLAEGEIQITLDGRVYEENAVWREGQAYLPLALVQRLDERFYWDGIENILIFTTPTELYKTELGNQYYHKNKNKITTTYLPVRTIGTGVYVAAEYVALYADMQYKLYEEPRRILIQAESGEYLYAAAKKTTYLRLESSIKSAILAEVETGDLVRFVDAGGIQENGFVKVMTEDGIRGFIQEKNLETAAYVAYQSDYVEPEYTHILKEDTVCMVWHMTTSAASNQYMAELMTQTKGVNVISPTWFRLSSESGELNEIADAAYVSKAHDMGLEVWGLVDNFSLNENDTQMQTRTERVLSRSTNRERLVNELIALAIKYNLDGLNIDFEALTVEMGPHFIQFLRELSIKCRSNGLVLSVDNPIPAPYNAFYDFASQAQLVDYVIIMAYDEHYLGSENAGPVASIGFVETALAGTLEKVPKEQIIMAIPFYTRHWKEFVREDGDIALTSEILGMSAAKNVVVQNEATQVWDAQTGQYYVEFDKDGVKNKLWLEEAESLDLKLTRIFDQAPAGVAAWRLGYEEAEIWNVILKYVTD